MFNQFPSVISHALKSVFGSYLNPHGVAVRQPNGQEELLVSYPHIESHFPEDYANHLEGFRDSIEAVVEAIPEKVEAEVEKLVEDVSDKIEEIEKKVEDKVEEVKAVVKAKPGPKPKVAE